MTGVQTCALPILLHNLGYKKCDKGKNGLISNTPKDIVDANYTIFEHANTQGYRNILVLEDDFLFDARLSTEPEYSEEIGRFLGKQLDTSPFLYYLGVLPILQSPTLSFVDSKTITGFQYPIEWSHNMVFISCGTHAIIYNRAFRDSILATDQSVVEDWDIYTNR